MVRDTPVSVRVETTIEVLVEVKIKLVTTVVDSELTAVMVVVTVPVTVEAMGTMTKEVSSTRTVDVQAIPEQAGIWKIAFSNSIVCTPLLTVTVDCLVMVEISVTVPAKSTSTIGCLGTWSSANPNGIACNTGRQRIDRKSRMESGINIVVSRNISCK